MASRIFIASVPMGSSGSSIPPAAARGTFPCPICPASLRSPSASSALCDTMTDTGHLCVPFSCFGQFAQHQGGRCGTGIFMAPTNVRPDSWLCLSGQSGGWCLRRPFRRHRQRGSELFGDHRVWYGRLPSAGIKASSMVLSPAEALPRIFIAPDACLPVHPPFAQH